MIEVLGCGFVGLECNSPISRILEKTFQPRMTRMARIREIRVIRVIRG